MSTGTDIATIQRSEAAGIGYLTRAGERGAFPVVLLHGIGSNAQSLAALMAALPPSFSSFAWDAPGYRASRPLAKASPTPRDYADAVAQWLDALDLDDVVLVGHSLGALFAASFAAAYPQSVAALALLSPALGYRVAAGAPLPPNVQDRIDEIEKLGPKAFAAKRAARLVGNPDANRGIVAAVEEAMATVNPAGYAQAVRALGAGDLLADAALIDAPALVAVGTLDVITPPANAQAAFEALKNPAAYREIEGAGHAMPQERPAAVAQFITNFVEDEADV